ncbi:hypothetical protein ScPMuIL_003413 [Solemya velum]
MRAIQLIAIYFCLQIKHAHLPGVFLLYGGDSIVELVTVEYKFRHSPLLSRQSSQTSVSGNYYKVSDFLAGVSFCRVYRTDAPVCSHSSTFLVYSKRIVAVGSSFLPRGHNIPVQQFTEIRKWGERGFMLSCFWVVLPWEQLRTVQQTTHPLG